MKKFLITLAVMSCLAIFFYKNPDTEANKQTLNPGLFNLSEIADGLYVHQGHHVPFDDPQHDDIANIGFIVGDDCVAIIDTGGSIEIAKRLKQSILSVTALPICYVINTHVHFDHILGNAVFQSEQTQFVGHALLAESMVANTDFFLAEFSEELGEYANNDGIIPPTILIDDSIELDLGNRVLSLRALPTAHSHTDLIVIDNKTSTAWLGDLLFVERIPALDGSLKGWLSVLKELEGLTFERAIPGHGPMVEWPAGAALQKNYLNVLLNQTRSSIAEGTFMEDVVEHVGKDEKLNWLLHDQHHKRNVTKAFSELEWE